MWQNYVASLVGELCRLTLGVHCRKGSAGKTKMVDETLFFGPLETGRLQREKVSVCGAKYIV